MTKTNLTWVVLCLCVLLVGAGIQSAEAAGAQIIKATLDKTGQHPGSAAVQRPATVTCLSASGVRGTCYIVAPGYTGQVARNQSVGTSGAGTVILNCNGTGDYLACSAKVAQ